MSAGVHRRTTAGPRSARRDQGPGTSDQWSDGFYWSPVTGHWSLIVLAALGLLAFTAGLVVAPQRAWAGLLVGSYYFLSLALFGTVFVALTHVFGAGWAVAFRRVPEAMSAFLPFGAAAMLTLFLGRAELYEWARPEAVAASPHLQHKALYLNAPFFLARMLLAFGVWIVFSRLLRFHSRQQDRDGDLAHTRRNQTYAAWFLVLFAVTFVFTGFDWIMSLEPGWYSTIFPLYLFSGLLLGGTAAMTVLVIWLRERGMLPGVTSQHLYELARMLAATTSFWAYIGFSQYLLVYYTNVPEEAVYYVRRLAGGGIPFALNMVLNWIVPIAMLIPVATRRSPSGLLRVCAVLLLGRWLDLYLLVVPGLSEPMRFGFPEALIPLGFLPLFLLPFFRTFGRAEPQPTRDPYLVESLQMQE